MPEIKTNFLIMMVLLSIASFCFFAINFQMKNAHGSIITNTLASQTAELTGNIVSGIIYFKIGARLGFSISFGLAAFGTFILIFVV